MKQQVLLVVLALTSTCSTALAQPAPQPAPSPPPPCTSEEFRAFDFWLGNWNVTTPQGQQAGHNTITSEAAGCLLIEHWQGVQGGSGQSYNFYDATTRQWRQLWVSPGVIIDYAGGLVDGAMQLEGEISYQNTGAREKFRGRWIPLENGNVRQELSQWNREIQAWDDWFTGIYAPLEAAPP